MIGLDERKQRSINLYNSLAHLSNLEQAQLSERVKETEQLTNRQLPMQLLKLKLNDLVST